MSLAYNRFRTIRLNLQMQSVLRLAVLNIRNEMIFHKMYDGVRLKEIVEREFQLSGYVDNESNLCALSLKNRIRDCRNLVYLHFSEGVGVGIICNGSLLRGHHGYGGEVSHIPIGDRSRQCPECGAYGCIEHDLSIPGIVKRYFGEERKNTLEAWKEFTDAIIQKEARAVELGTSIAVYLGELADIYDVLFPEMNKIIQKKCYIYGNRSVNIVKDTQSDMTINSGINESIYSHWRA